VRRALPAVAGTAAVLAAVLGYKSGPPPGKVALTGTSAPAPPDAAATSEPPPTAPPAASTPTTRPPTTTTAPATAARSAVGADIQTRFGPVQVKAVVQNGRLVDVQTVQMPTSHTRSAYISQQAAPMLRREALDAQSANIDIISGATYTSEGYAQSLQAALDALRK
jgi:uncharacterized protein with FMN-binding domain